MRASLGAISALLFSCSVLLVTPAPGAAQTADDAAAQAHFTVAASYYDQGEYEDALREFENAYRLSHRAQLFYNFSLCYQQLGDIPHAVEYLERYLGEVTEIPNRTTLEVRLENLRERLAAASTSTSTTGTTTTGTETATTTGTATTETGTTGTTSTTLETGTGTTATSESGTGTSTTSAPDGGGGGGGVNAGAIAGFSVAALGLVGVGIFGGLTIGESGSLSSGCGMTSSCTPAQTSTMQTYALVTDISWGVALAGAVVGTVMLVVGGTGGGSDGSASLEVTPMAGPGTAGLNVSGSF